VTRKISSSAAKIKLGIERELRLGNIEAKRDWGHAQDYVRAMWLMLQQDQPDDYVIATGQTRTVKEFVEAAFDYVDLDYRNYLVIDQELYRPSEVHVLQGDASKAHKKLKWQPAISFDALVKEMVEADLKWYTRV
jgi:GDPmannose 4,6-dehydratase